VAQRAPGWFNAESKGFWRRYAPLLEANGSLTELDYPAFTSMAVSYGLMIEAAETMTKEGLTMAGTGHDRDTEKRHPAALIYQTQEGIFRAGCERFGLTPLARGRMKLEPPESDGDGLLD